MIYNIKRDKLLHFAVCAILTAVLKLVMPFWIVILAVSVVAVVKEIRDKVTGKGNAEWGDLLADFIGIIIGIL